MFVDCMGDSFCWKGENVFCVEVEEVILFIGKVREVVVYGVLIFGEFGKVGMVFILLIECLEEGKIFNDFLY